MIDHRTRFVQLIIGPKVFDGDFNLTKGVGHLEDHLFVIGRTQIQNQQGDSFAVDVVIPYSTQDLILVQKIQSTPKEEND